MSEILVVNYNLYEEAAWSVSSIADHLTESSARHYLK